MVVFSGALRKLVEMASPVSLHMLPEDMASDFALLLVFSAFAVHEGPKGEKYALIDFICRKGFLKKYNLKKTGSRILFRPSDVEKALKRQPAKFNGTSPSMSLTELMKG
jgi:hypothetical protein